MIGNLEDFQSDDAITIPKRFKITEVDGLTSEAPNTKDDVLSAFKKYDQDPDAQGVEDARKAVPGKLNILAKLKGKFRGGGLNMIFRPSFGNIRRDNVLEYNVTEEVTQFQADIGDVYNRGLGKQQDVIIRAVPYSTMISDLLDKKTGKPSWQDPIPIHFENGQFLRVPPTDFRPKVEHGTICRLASIPHGTTINCQGIEPDMKKPISGAPVIKPVSVLPFQRGAPTDQVTFNRFFPQLNFQKSFDLRIPRELKAGGFLTEALVNNPNQLLIDQNNSSKKKSIKEHYHFTLNSDSSISGLPGGGTQNIAFLYGPGTAIGAQNNGPNAAGVVVNVDYWISTVVYDVLLPEGDYSEEPKTVVVKSESRKEEKAAGQVIISPKFAVKLSGVIAPNTVVQLEATQVQYSQNVTLDFDEMGWPHISVATLTPMKPVPANHNHSCCS